MLRLRRPSASELRQIADEHASMACTYDCVGATLGDDLPAGYRHTSASARLGAGSRTFERAAAALSAWEVQRGAGFEVSHGAGTDPGSVVALAAPLPVGWAVAACRIVAVVDEPSRYGFAYGTLPGHPESGEELFVVERDANDSTWFRVVAFSRPSGILTRLAGPVASGLQKQATRRYLRAMQRATAAS